MGAGVLFLRFRFLGGVGCREGRDWGFVLSSSWVFGGIG